MKLSGLGEFGLISRIRRSSSGTGPPVLIGIGDDAAALKLTASHTLLATTDLLLEDVHFDLSYTDYYSLGWKSAAVNLSDIAAMGGNPLCCLTALGIPPTVRSGRILEFYRGFKELLALQNTSLVGGDTCLSRNRLFISVTAIGEAKADRIITRSGARPGDIIFVTGNLGDSAAGLEILQARSRKTGMRNKKAKLPTSRKAIAQLIERHLRPVPRVDQGRIIAESGCASAMIDVSDGLSSDLNHICEESGVGADIRIDRIPLSAELRKFVAGRSKAKHAVEYALSGGEDYELLFTVPKTRVRKLHSLKLPVTEIGVITSGRTISLGTAAGHKSRLKPKGFDHFKSIPWTAKNEAG